MTVDAVHARLGIAAAAAFSDGPGGVIPVRVVEWDRRQDAVAASEGRFARRAEADAGGNRRTGEGPQNCAQVRPAQNVIFVWKPKTHALGMFLKENAPGLPIYWTLGWSSSHGVACRP